MKRICLISLKILPLICIILTFTGCWESLDIEKRNILTALIVDKKDDNYYYYTEVAAFSNKKSGQSESQSNSSFDILISKGKTFTETRDNYNLKSINKLFLGASRILVFTDRLSETGIEEYVNRLRGQVDYRKSLLIATTTNEPMEILKIAPVNSDSIGFAIESNLQSSITDGTSFKIDVGDVLEVIAVKKAGFLLPNIKIAEDQLAISGYTVFNNKAKSLGEIPAEKRKGLVYLLNPSAIFYYDIPQNNNTYTIKTALKSKDIKVTYSENQLNIRVDLKIKANIDFSQKMELIDQETEDAIKNKLKEEVKKEVEEAIQVSQKQYKCDYLGFYRYYRAIDPKEFEKMDWSEVYSNAKVEVEPNIIINQTEIPFKK